MQNDDYLNLPGRDYWQAYRQDDYWQRWLDETRSKEAELAELTQLREQHRLELLHSPQEIYPRSEFGIGISSPQPEPIVNRPGSELQRHWAYNAQTAAELESAMGRAAEQGIDYTDQKQFQAFLDREAEQGLYQSEGKRPLADRYAELCEQCNHYHSGTAYGSIGLYESAWEQEYRIGKAQEIIDLDNDFQQTLSPAQQKLAAIRERHGIDEGDRIAPRRSRSGQADRQQQQRDQTQRHDSGRTR